MSWPYWLMATGACIILATLVVGYVYPPTRPAVRKLWWLWVAGAIALLGGAMLMRIRTDTDRGASAGTGEGMAAEGANSLQAAVDRAMARAASADAQLAADRAAARATGDTSLVRAEIEGRRKVIEEIADPVERRRQLIAFVQSTERPSAPRVD